MKTEIERARLRQMETKYKIVLQLISSIYGSGGGGLRALRNMYYDPDERLLACRVKNQKFAQKVVEATIVFAISTIRTGVVMATDIAAVPAITTIKAGMMRRVRRW